MRTIVPIYFITRYTNEYESRCLAQPTAKRKKESDPAQARQTRAVRKSPHVVQRLYRALKRSGHLQDRRLKPKAQGSVTSYSVRRDTVRNETS